MEGSVYLIGGGEIGKGETLEIDKELKKRAARGGVFVFFGTAANNSPAYLNKIRQVYGDSFNVLAPTEEGGRDFAISAIESASVIYLGGGTTELLLDLFARWDLTKHLVTALDRGALVAGISAGAQALSSWYIHEEDGPMELRQGWGIVPACVLVHAKQESLLQAKSLWRNNRDICADQLVAIGDGAAWNVGPSGTESKGRGQIWTVID